MDVVNPRELCTDHNIREEIELDSEDSQSLVLSMSTRIAAGKLPNESPITWYWLDGEKVVLSGHRRTLCAIEAGAEKVFVAEVVRPPTLSDDLIAQLTSNSSAVPLSSVEQGRAIVVLLEEGLTQKDVANLLGKGKAWVNVRVSLAEKIVPELQEAIVTGQAHFQAVHLACQLDKETQYAHLKQIADAASTTATSYAAKQRVKKLRAKIKDGLAPTDERVSEIKETEKEIIEHTEEQEPKDDERSVQEESPEQAALRSVEQLLEMAKVYIDEAKEVAKENNIGIEKDLGLLKETI